eukprot:2013002-Pyramimonas_sp.AAC.1
MCYAPTSLVKVDGARRPGFAIETGAAQGCPASGPSWAIAMGPLIRRIAAAAAIGLDSAGATSTNYQGACAGDLGIACESVAVIGK